MVNNKFYYYDGWTAKVGEKGVNSVTFKLAPESQMADQAEADRVKGDGQSNYLTTRFFHGCNGNSILSESDQ